VFRRGRSDEARNADFFKLKVGTYVCKRRDVGLLRYDHRAA